MTADDLGRKFHTRRRSGEPTPEHVAVYCHGCGHAWWNDAECTCTCKPGDPNYEKWACPSAVGFEVLNG